MSVVVQAKIDEEYMSLMAELGEAPPGAGGAGGAPGPLRRVAHSPFAPAHPPRAIMSAGELFYTH